MEIERKFLADHEAWARFSKPEPEFIAQGFIHNTKEVTVRVRIRGDKAYLTIKGQTKGIAREEFEYAIPTEEGKRMLELFCPRRIEKERYCIPMGKHTWEVDVFHGKLSGLILAEIELEAADEAFEKPDFVGREVSEDPRYFNAILIELDSLQSL